jgi:prepilin-type N-terminal cleavage/methylation domain-containing protein
MNDKGFTLIETIVVLVLTGMLAAVAGVGIATGARGFVAAREASEMAQEAQLAMDRLSRDIMELVDIPANSSSTLLVLRNVGARGTAQFDRSIQYVADARAIRIADGTGGAANGDTLIDNVTNFSFAYLRQQEDGTQLISSSTWASDADSRLLAAVDVTFTLTAPGGTSHVFTNRIVPRNNENRGGNVESVRPPSLARYDVCFVATAAAGYGDHPVVVQLREFRDRLLLPWSGGRALVRAYYAVGPDMARVVAAHEPLRAATLAVLTPVAALAGLAVHAPGWLAAMVVLAVLLAGAALRALRPRGQDDEASPATHSDGQRGAVLLSAIVTIVAFSVLAATMVPMMTGSMMGEIAAVQGDQAYYLAESGFGAAGSMFLAAGTEQARKDLLETMDGSTYTFAGNAGSFTLAIEPYWFEVTAKNSNTLTTKVYGHPPTLPTSRPGRLRIGTGSIVYPYSTIGVSGDAVTFTLTGTTATVPAGTDVYLTGNPSASGTVTERGNLTLTTDHAAAFPDVNGMFTIRDASTGQTGRISYVYRRKNGSTLEDVRLVEGQGVSWSNISLTTASEVTLEAYLRLHSTGRAPGGLTREVVYNVPIGWILGGGNFSKEQYQDTFDTLNAWFTGGSSQGQLGSHAISSGSLRITGMQTAATSALGNLFSWFGGSNQWSTLFFNYGVTNISFGAGWLDTLGNSSYDMQFKTQVANQGNEGQYFGGVLFRGRNYGNSDLDGYGLSFVRFRLEQDMLLFITGPWYLPGDVPASLIPGYQSVDNPGPLFPSTYQTITIGNILLGSRSRLSQPAILLWERRNGNFNWLAYKLLGQSSGIITYNGSGPTYSLKDWSSLLLRLVEGQEVSFRNGGGTDGAGGTLRINYGDAISTTSGATARVIGQPIVTDGDWASGSAQGTLVLTNVDTSQGTFGNGQALKVNNVQHAVLSAAGVGGKTNFIRVYYGDNNTSSSTTGDATPYNPTSPGANTSYTTSQRIRNPRITTSASDKLNWIPDDYEQWTSATDFFSLVQWDGVNTSVSGVTSLGERLNNTNLSNTIVRSTNLLSPTYDASNPDYTPQEGIAIVTSGPTGDNFYFDDFGLQLDVRGGKGFLPPIQQ